jgi:hypothetical protein
MSREENDIRKFEVKIIFLNKESATIIDSLPSLD